MMRGVVLDAGSSRSDLAGAFSTEAIQHPPRQHPGRDFPQVLHNGARAMRFLIVEDHPLFREALEGALQMVAPTADILQATSIDGALEQVVGDIRARSHPARSVDARHDWSFGHHPHPQVVSQNSRRHRVRASGSADHFRRLVARRVRLHPQIVVQARSGAVDRRGAARLGLCSRRLSRDASARSARSAPRRISSSACTS